MRLVFRFAALLLAAACRPDAPATERGTPQPADASAATGAGPAHATDTLQLPGGRVLTLRPSTAATFAALPESGLKDVFNDSTAEVQALTTAGGRVRRQGLDLLLQSTQGGPVRLASTPAARFTIENGDAVRYQYWGSLPAAHQWVVRAWYWESAGTVLVDQRTGRQLELPGDPTASPDGRLVLLTSPGLSGGDQPNMLALVQIGTDGPRRLWVREPTAWEPNAARWAAPNKVVLQLRRPDAEGNLPDAAPDSYAELTLPPAQ